MIVPLVDLRAQMEEVAPELWPNLKKIFENAAFVGGPAVNEFEREYAAYTGATHCIGVANGTDALEIALRAAGVTRGDSVVVPANSFVATAEAVERIGATTVFVDVDDDYLLMDPALVPAARTTRTTAVVPVHLFGQTAPVNEIRQSLRGEGVALIEDCAQAQGATRAGRAAGSLGDASATSFYPGKNLGAAGDAGAVVTDDDDIASTARLLGAHGSSAKYRHDVLGFNSRLDAVQAVVLSAKLTRLAKWNALRSDAAARYTTMLAGVDGVRVPRSAPGNDDVWHLYVARVPDRDRVLKVLQDNGIGAGIHYPVPLHLTPALRHRAGGRGSFPVAERAADEMLSLPIYPHITIDQQEHVVSTLANALRG